MPSYSTQQLFFVGVLCTTGAGFSGTDHVYYFTAKKTGACGDNTIAYTIICHMEAFTFRYGFQGDSEQEQGCNGLTADGIWLGWGCNTLSTCNAPQSANIWTVVCHMEALTFRFE